MSSLGSTERPLRVAVVGSGPSGFYAADALLKSDFKVSVDVLERLPVPYGLVRYGVAPDHPKIKNVIKVYDKTADHPSFRFLGNVTVGEDITIDDLKDFYDAIIISTGAEADRKLGIHGEHLLGSHTATEFVGWYNGHPDHRGKHFDLTHEQAVIIGQGNVALDVARILCKTVEELKNTDIAQHALDVLAVSRIKAVHVIGRRGPVQAAFTPVEIREFGELADCACVIDPNDLDLGPACQAELNEPKNVLHRKNYEILKQLAKMEAGSKKRRCFIHFFKSPIEIVGYSGYWMVGNEGHITTMVVIPKYRRLHNADILLYSLIKSSIQNNIKWLTLEVRVSNLSAINLYKKYKFNQLGVRKKYYQDNNEDALIFWTDDITKPEYLEFISNVNQPLLEKFAISDKLHYSK